MAPNSANEDGMGRLRFLNLMIKPEDARPPPKGLNQIQNVPGKVESDAVSNDDDEDAKDPLRSLLRGGRWVAVTNGREEHPLDRLTDEVNA